MSFADLLRRLYGPIVVEGTLPAPPSTVYGVLADPTTYPDWLVGNTETRSVERSFPDRGATFDHTVGVTDPLTLDDSTESLGAEPDRRLSLLVNAGPFHARVVFELEPAAGDATMLRFGEQPVGPIAILTPFLRMSLSARNRESMRRLTELVASGDRVA